MNRSLWRGRRDVEWWIPFVCATALALPLIPCAALGDRLMLDLLRAIAFGLMGYIGFWIAGRSYRKKYVNPGVDGIGGALLGLVGLIGTVAFGFPWLVLAVTYKDGENGPTPIEETMYGDFVINWPPIVSIYTAIFFSIWFLIAIYHVARRNVVDEQIRAKERSL